MRFRKSEIPLCRIDIMRLARLRRCIREETGESITVGELAASIIHAVLEDDAKAHQKEKAENGGTRH